jgi:hypothetical protein
MPKAKRQPEYAQGFIRVPRRLLRPASWNYKRQDETRQAKLLAQIQRNGQVENIIVRLAPDSAFPDAPFEVVNGNHRLPVFEALAIDEPMCFNLGPISLAAAKRVAVETNETTFDADPLALASIVREIMEEFGVEDFELTSPYTADDLAHFGDLLSFDWDSFQRGGDEKIEPPAREESGDWQHFTIRMPEAAYRVWRQAGQEIERRLAADGQRLHENGQIAEGQIAEMLAAEFLAGVQVE